MARRFNGTSELIKFQPGGCSALTEFTIAAMFKRNDRSAGHWHALLSMLQGTLDTSGDNMTVEVTASDFSLAADQDQPTLDTAAGFIQSIAANTHLNNTTDWWILAVSYPAGSHIPRVHLKNFTQGTAWVHADMSGSVAPGAATNVAWEIRAGAFQVTDWLNGDVTVMAWWNSNLSDAQVVAALGTAAYNDWKAGTGGAGAPAAVWPIGDATRLGTAAAAIPDDTGTSTWKSTVGTTFVADPGGWSWGAGNPALSDELTRLRGARQAVKRSTFFCLGEKWTRRRSGLIVPRPSLAGA